ncbi:hypothetical protein KIP00_21560 [Vibrio sp. B513a]|uniref:hypothetical protein n=1 Tax=Vibrio sp. B513a TaxID=2836183 RepID=UPI00255785EC|nr:hypothetical protein [Vibrio sp. B513a]MDK9753619.1 hypothetical protein [Vibrio sp. B513a]
MDNLETVSLLIESLDSKMTAALIGAVLAGIFSLINAYVSHSRNKDALELKAKLEHIYTKENLLLAEVSDKHSHYLKEALTALIKIKHLTSYIATRAFDKYGDLNATCSSIYEQLCTLEVSLQMLGKTEAIASSDLNKINDCLFTVKQNWVCVYSDLYKLDDASTSERKVLLEDEMMKDWYILVREIDKLSEEMYSALSLVSATKT